MANILTGDQDDNFLYGSWEDDILRGLGGKDFLMGGGGNDTFEGGTGNDRLEDFGGNNTYLFARGDGQDEILAYDPVLTKHNTIRFGEGIAPGDILVERVNDSLVLRIAGTTDSITVMNYFMTDWKGSHPYAIEEVRFFDGARWDSLAILTKVNTLIELDDNDNYFGGGNGNGNVDGKGGNDQLYGSWNDDVMRGGDGNDKLRSLDGDDFLIGGAGDDLLDGGRGVNTMLFAQGWGHDTVILVDMDMPAGTIIEIAGALPGTLLLSRSDDGAGNDLIISAKGASDTITVTGYFDQNYASAAVTLRISYADGSIWNYDQIQQATSPMPPVFELIGTEGNDSLQTDWGNGRLVGLGGDDQLYGGQGADVLDGGEGVDNLVGNDGDDLLAGGAGDDTLQGDQGNDVLLGGDGNDMLRGGDGDDILDAGAGNAHLDGGDGNNFILFGRSAGEYRLIPAWNGINTIILASDVRPEDIRVTSYNSWEVAVEIKGSMARILMPLVSDWQSGNYDQTLTRAQLQFADGTVWDDAILARKRYTGDDENNSIEGSQYGDWMDGQGGNDMLQGRDGNDSMRAGRGDDFMDGGSGNDILLGQDGNDHLMGADGDDILNGGAGDDFLIGAMGNNVFQVDLHGGIDTIYSWYQEGAHNTLQFGEGIAPGDVLVRIDPNSGNLIVSFNGSQDQVTVIGYIDKYYGNPEGLHELRFANGVSWNVADIRRESTSGNDGDNVVDGTAGNDTMDGKGGNDRLFGFGGDDVLLGGDGDDMLEGDAGNNTLNGGRGNDFLSSDAGADTYVFNIGDGQDVINEYSWGWGWQVGVDYVTLPNTIRFGAGIAPTDLQFVQSGGTLYIYYASQDSIAIQYTDTHGPIDKLPVDRFEFADNSVWTYRELINHAPELMVPVGEVWSMEGHALDFQIPSYTFFDQDPEVLRYELARADGGDLPAWLQFDPLTGKISGTPGYDDSGELDLKVTARDNVGATASDIFKLKVTPFDPAPKLREEIATQHATEASPFSIAIAADTFVDPDGGPLFYKLRMANGEPLPAWLHFDGATLSGIAGDADTGILKLRLSATDAGGNTVFADYTLDVANINQAPTLVQAPASQSVEDGVAFGYVLPENMFSDADAGDSGVLAIDGLPAGFSFDAQSRTISGTAALAAVGQHALTVSFTDAGGLAATAPFTLTVTAAASMSLTGTAGADALTGKSNSDVLLGLGGDDVLNGGIGADRMEGGNGNDIFHVDNTGDVVVENSAAGVDTVMAAIDYTLGVNVERLTLTGNANLHATGNTLNNVITGNGGANLINGGLGDDSMAGGAGNDTYMVGSTSDSVTEALDAGFDYVISSVGRTLGANQEALTLTGTATINGTGNLLNNLLQGNGGINTLSGGDGHDILQGGAGDDYLSDGSVLGNLFDGGLGIDRLVGGAGADLFIGGAGNDTISTGTGADIIVFNRGDGADSVAVTTSADNTVSLGNGILFSDLALLKSGSDLILKAGLGEQISFKGWYSNASANSVGTLQVVTEGGADYVAGSASAIHDNKIEQFNFTALVAKFDQARVGQGSSFSWSLGSSLEQFSSGGSDSAAIGADLAYQYAVADTLAALSAMPALAIVGIPSFGTGSQGLQGASALNDGIAVLY